MRGYFKMLREHGCNIELSAQLNYHFSVGKIKIFSNKNKLRIPITKGHTMRAIPKGVPQGRKVNASKHGLSKRGTTIE